MTGIAATTVAWVGDGEPRLEVAHVRIRGGEPTAAGTQLGAVYELRYELELLGDRRVRFSSGSPSPRGSRAAQRKRRAGTPPTPISPGPV